MKAENVPIGMIWTSICILNALMICVMVVGVDPWEENEQDKVIRMESLRLKCC